MALAGVSHSHHAVVVAARGAPHLDLLFGATLADSFAILGILVSLGGGLVTLVWGFNWFYRVRLDQMEKQRQSLLTFAKRHDRLVRRIPRLLKSSSIVSRHVEHHNAIIDLILLPYVRLLEAAHNFERRTAGMPEIFLTWPSARLNEVLINASFDQMRLSINQERTNLDLDFAKKQVVKMSIPVMVLGALLAILATVLG